MCSDAVRDRVLVGVRARAGFWTDMREAAGRRLANWRVTVVDAVRCAVAGCWGSGRVSGFVVGGGAGLTPLYCGRR